jgi:hemerythrin-like domain-containing protein
MNDANSSEPASGSSAPAQRIVDPIEFLYAQHDRQLVICAALDRLANAPDGEDATETAQLVLDYAATEMPLHLADEEKDLFPRLIERCDPEDALDNIVDQLEHEHETDSALYHRLEHGLKAIARGAPLAHPEVFCSDAQSFSMLQRRHLNWENGTVLPLARQKLTPEDLAEMRDAMSARRHGTELD